MGVRMHTHWTQHHEATEPKMPKELMRFKAFYGLNNTSARQNQSQEGQKGAMLSCLVARKLDASATAILPNSKACCI